VPIVAASSAFSALAPTTVRAPAARHPTVGIGVVALVMRLRMTETPAFEAAVTAGARVTNPTTEVVKRHRPNALRVFVLTG